MEKYNTYENMAFTLKIAIYAKCKYLTLGY